MLPSAEHLQNEATAAQAANNKDWVLRGKVTRTGAATQEAIAFEQAIDQVINGDRRRGLSELAEFPQHPRGPVWRASFLLWRLAPALARPMLRWRRRRHSRGYQPRNLARLFRARRAA